MGEEAGVDAEGTAVPVAEGTGTGSLSHCSCLPFPATEKDEPEYWLTVSAHNFLTVLLRPHNGEDHGQK